MLLSSALSHFPVLGGPCAVTSVSTLVSTEFSSDAHWIFSIARRYGLLELNRSALYCTMAFLMFENSLSDITLLARRISLIAFSDSPLLAYCLSYIALAVRHAK